MKQVFSLVENLLVDMMKWYGPTFKAAVIDVEGRVPVLVVVLKDVSGISFTSRGEISWFFMKRAIKDYSEEALQMIIFSEKEVKYGIPYLFYVSSLGKVLYDPEGVFAKGAKVQEENGEKILLLADIKKGEVVEIEQQ